MARTYELRTYVAEPGQLDLLLDRFRDHTVELFARHGMTSIGYWLSDKDEDTLLYLLAHEDRASAAESWKAFRADPEWQAVKADSEKDGPIVRSVTSLLLEPTDFSALR
ncbi:MAG TPA: NIPSNAP family protein [Propionibacteriaceae bacterium]|nr:NIPSNAP family protein [Propionibacteriaceae bacterium]